MKLENIAIIGNGGRENSLAWAIQKSHHVKGADDPAPPGPHDRAAAFLAACRNFGFTSFTAASKPNSAIKYFLESA